MTYLNAQTSISCSAYSNSIFNESTNKYDSDTVIDESSLFVINKTETMITHTTETQKSVYYITNKIYSNKLHAVTYEATSDVGNKYRFYIRTSTKDKFVAVAPLYITEVKALTTFIVKSVF